MNTPSPTPRHVVVVADDDLVVAREMNVAFDEIDADVDRALEGTERVFGRAALVAAVAADQRRSRFAAELVHQFGETTIHEALLR